MKAIETITNRFNSHQFSAGFFTTLMLATLLSILIINL